MKIQAAKREKTGHKAKGLLDEKIIPAVIYGPKRKSTNIEVPFKDFHTAFNEVHYSKILDIELPGEKKESKALIREVQTDPLTDEVIHASFLELDLAKPITVEVPIVTKGVSKAVKDNIGFLMTPLNSITLKCLPENLPSEVTIDISALNEIGDSIMLNEIKLPEGVQIAMESIESVTLAFIAPPQKEIVEEEVVPAEGEAVEGEAQEEEEAAEEGTAEAGEEEEKKNAEEGKKEE